MKEKPVAAYGMYSQDVPVGDVVHTLNDAGFDNENICMMVSPNHPIATVLRGASVFNGEGDTNTDAAGLIGWLSGFGAVVIPTLGFFIRSPAFFRALVSARQAPALCGDPKTLVSLGFSEGDAVRFERELGLGSMGVLVYISCGENTKTAWARELLRRTGAVEAATLSHIAAAAVAA
jgi:hypothetical protein